MIEFKHVPVMLNEVIEGLNIKPNGVYVDCTIGGGGHSYEICKRLKTGRLIGFDRDQEAIDASLKRLEKFKNVTIIKSNFHDAKEKLLELGITKVDGILIDLGVSSHQIDDGDRGFSFLHDAPLDMRMDKDQKLSAWDVVNKYPQEKLLKILYEYGEESNAKKIVANIVNQRKIKPIDTTFKLKEIIENSFPKKVIYTKGGVSKQTFQAVRIEVNGELSGLKETIEGLSSLLNHGGRFAILTFHSLEDRIVKNCFKDFSTDCICPPKTPICICNHKAKGFLVNKKPIVPTKEEVEINSRSSCSKLRIFEAF